MSLVCCFRVEREKARPETSAPQGGERERPKRRKPKGLSTVAGCAGGLARSSGEALVMGVERRGRVIRVCSFDQPEILREELHEQLKVSGKPFDISKREVWEAYGGSRPTRVRREWMGLDRRIREGSEEQTV